MYNRVKEVYKELYTKDAEFRLDVDSGSILKLIVSILMVNDVLIIRIVILL